jgi:hypothetical protein
MPFPLCTNFKNICSIGKRESVTEGRRVWFGKLRELYEMHAMTYCMCCQKSVYPYCAQVPLWSTYTVQLHGLCTVKHCLSRWHDFKWYILTL